MITRKEYLMGRDKEFPLSEEQEANLEVLITALNKFRAAYGHPMVVTSGYRPPALNKAVGGALRSNHMSCLACDFKDANGALDEYCMDHPEVLEECGLYLEHPDSTPGWCHLQATPPASKRRVFRP